MEGCSNLIPKAWRHIGILLFFKKKSFYYLFIFGCPGLCCGMKVSHCGGFSCYKAQALQPGLNSCDSGLSCSLGLWNPPAPGNELLSPVLANGFFTTEPLGKSPANNSYVQIWICPGRAGNTVLHLKLLFQYKFYLNLEILHESRNTCGQVPKVWFFLFFNLKFLFYIGV